MYRLNEDLFKHIFDEIIFLESETSNMTKEVFLQDEKTQRAFARSIEIIGEAVKNISNEVIVKYKEVPWRSIAGMRDKIIHGYFPLIMKLYGMLQRILFPNLSIS